MVTALLILEHHVALFTSLQAERSIGGGIPGSAVNRSFLRREDGRPNLGRAAAQFENMNGHRGRQHKIIMLSRSCSIPPIPRRAEFGLKVLKFFCQFRAEVKVWRNLQSPLLHAEF